MLKIQRRFIESCLLILLLMTLFLLASVSATAQELTNSQHVQDEVASKGERAEMKQPSETALTTGPVYKDFMGVTLGMGANEVRAKLGHLKDKGERQDFFVFSESQSAQVVYDDQGKVIVISVDYLSKDGNAPSPESVLGEPVQAKKDGSIYQLKRYPVAGYWVAYNRTAGDDPIVTVTMQKI
jgi:hypothetical protein